MTTLIDTVRKFVKSVAIKRKIAFFYENHGNGFEKWLGNPPLLQGLQK